MAAYAPGGQANAFLRGAVGAASAVHGIARDDRNDLENTRRYDVEQDRINRTEQRQLDEIEAKKDTIRWQHMNDAAGGDPDRMVEMFGGAVTEMINTSRTFKPMRDALLQGERVNRDKPMAGLVAFNGKGGKKSYSVLLNAVNPETGEAYQAPLSTGRGTKDPVPLGTAKDLVNAINTHLSAYGLQDNKTLIDALERTQGGRGGQQAAPVQAAPAAAAPSQTPATTTTRIALPPGGMTATGSVAAPAIAASTPEATAPTGRVQDMPTLGKTITDAGTALGQATGGSVADIARSLDEVTAPARYARAKSALTNLVDPGLAGSATRTFSRDVVNAKTWHTNRAQLMADPEFSKETVAKLDASYGTGEATAVLGDTAQRVAPGTVASEKQQDKLSTNLPAIITPALRATAVTSIMQPTSGRKPNRDQLASALILRRAGIIDGKQLTHYARTGEYDKAELQAFSPENDLYRDGVKVQSGVPKVDAARAEAAAKAATAAVSHYESSMKDLIKDFNPSSSKFAPKYTMAGLGEYTAESFTELAKLGFPVDPQILAYNPTIKAVLATAYREAVDKGHPPGWFTAAVRKPLHEAMAEKYPGLVKPEADVRTVNVNGVQRKVTIKNGVPYYID